MVSSRIIKKLILLSISLIALPVTGFCYEYSDETVDLGRLSIARVSASSVNGNRSLDNKFYGILNLFDDGKNFINNINYTNWMTDPELKHWVKIRFKSYVCLEYVTVEQIVNDEKRRVRGFAVTVAKLNNNVRKVIKRYDSTKVEGFRKTFKLPKPVKDINEITIVFNGPRLIDVSELYVMGKVKKGIKVDKSGPLIEMSKKEKQGPHVIDIDRVVKKENDLKLIKKAENIYPDKGNVLKASRKKRYEKHISGEKNLWWYNEFDNIRIPYAVTTDAIEYYSNLIKQYRQKEWGRDIKPSSHFIYHAEVFFKDNYKINDKCFANVNVIRMELHFKARFSSLAGVTFKKERIILIDLNGKVVLISGDGPTSVWVS